MRLLFLIALSSALTLGCTDEFEASGGGDDDSGGTADDDDHGGDDDDDDDGPPDPCEGADPTDPCCADALPAIYFGSSDIPQDQAFTGHFSDWALGSVDFVTSEGEVIEFWIEGSPTSFILLPDLSAHGEVELLQQGGCDPKGGYYNAVHVYEPGDAEATLLLTGSRGIEDLAGWTLDSPSNNQSCVARPSEGCNEFLHNRPVHVTFQGQPHTLYQGTEAIIGGFDVLITVAQSGSGVYDCADGPGTELDNWVIVPHADAQ